MLVDWEMCNGFVQHLETTAGNKMGSQTVVQKGSSRHERARESTSFGTGVQ